MTIKIAHLADTHLGYRQYGLIEREKDFYDTFKTIIDDIIEKDVDYVIHCGDLFERPKPPIKALLVAQEGFLKLMENNIPVIVIAGNHDKLQRRETSIPQELYENDNFHILTIENPNIELTEDLVVSGLPFIQKSHEDVVKDLLKDIFEDVKDYEHKILMLHGGVSKYFDFNPEFELDTIPEGFDYYAMGHIHQRIIEKDFKNGILSFPGSTEIMNKGEIKEYEDNGKGYNILTIDENVEVEYVNIELERKIIDKEIPYPQLDEKLEELENYINNEILVKTDKKPVLLINVVEGNFDKADVSEKITEKLEDIALKIKLSYQPTEDEETIITKGENALNAEELICEKLSETYNNKYVGQLGVDLFRALSNHELEETYNISETFYNNKFKMTKGEDNDNQ